MVVQLEVDEYLETKSAGEPEQNNVVACAQQFLVGGTGFHGHTLPPLVRAGRCQRSCLNSSSAADQEPVRYLETTQPPIVYDGTLDGDRIKGVCRRNGQNMSLDFVRGDLYTEPPLINWADPLRRYNIRCPGFPAVTCVLSGAPSARSPYRV